LFPHLDDPAYRKLVALEELVANFVAKRATSSFKQRLQRAIARVSETLVELADSERSVGSEPLLADALLNCRKAANAVQFLHRAGIFTRACAVAAFDLLADIVQMLIERLCEARGLPAPEHLARPLFDEGVGAMQDETAAARPPPLAS
jgi:hypothetical protein